MTKLAPSARVYQAIWCLEQINVNTLSKEQLVFMQNVSTCTITSNFEMKTYSQGNAHGFKETLT